MHADRWPAVAEVSDAMLSKIHDGHDSYDFHVASHHIYIGRLHRELVAAITLGVYVYVVRAELASDALFCCSITPMEITPLPSDVLSEPFHELGVHGVWNIHGRTENMGRSQSRRRSCRR